MSVSELSDPSRAEGEGLLKEWTDGSDSLLIALGGMGHKRRPQFQLYALTRNFPVNRIYMRDPFRSWYHHGHPPISKNIDETADHILELMQAKAIRRVVITGISAGGYGAILLGWLLEADEVHAITPQTYIDTDNRLKNDDHLGQAFMPEMYRNPNSRIDYFDLKPLLESTPKIRTKFHIYYSDASRTDLCHAKHLEGIPNVELHSYETRGHRLSMHMTRTGDLGRVLRAAFEIS